MRDGDSAATEVPSTTAGLQQAIDALLGGKGKVFIGPGTLQTTTAIWLHSYCHIEGSGRGVTIIQRAPGSITDGDAANSGAVFATSAYGANGTLSSSSSIQYDISISNLTLDGNSSVFGGLSATTAHQAGLLARSVDGLRVNSARAQNTLRSGWFFDECKNVECTNIEADTVGQHATSTTRNAIDFYNYSAATAGHGKAFVCDGFKFSNIGDNAIVCANVQNVVVSNGTVDTCDSLFEVLGSTATPDKNISLSNITATNLSAYAFLVASGAISSGRAISNILLSNIAVEFNATTHSSEIITFESSTANAVSGIRVENCIFRNINSADTTATKWINMDSNSSATYRDIMFDGCSFYGKPGSIRTNDKGLFLNSKNPTAIRFKNCLFKDVPGIGVQLGDVTAAIITDVTFDGVTVDTATDRGFAVGGSFNGATISNIYFLNCTAINTNTGLTDKAFQLITNGVGFTIRNVYFRGCRAYRTSGSTMLYGIELNNSAGTLDKVIIENCDFDGVVTGDFKAATGTPTNVRFTTKPGRGSDIVAAATIAIPTDGTTFHVTGNTNVTNGITVNAWDNGRTVTLIFEGTPTVSDTGTSKLAGNFVAAGTTNDFDTLTICCDATNWTEVARSTN